MLCRLTATVATFLVAEVAAQPPWLPWKIENDNLVSGLVTFPHPPGCDIKKVGGGCVWIADEKSESVAACQALCEASGVCNSFDFSTSWTPKPGATGVCYFRSDHFWTHEPGTGRNHTCGTRVKSDPTPPPPGPAPPPPPLPPLPPVPPVHPPLGHQPNIIFILTDDQDRTLGEHDYTHLGSLQVMPNVQSELIAKGAFLQNFFVNTPICCPSRTEFFSGRYYHNIGPPGDPGGCMHVDTANAVHPLTSLFGLMKRAGYEVGAFGKVTNDQAGVLKMASTWDTMDYIDSPVNYNDFMGRPYWRKFQNGTYFTETIDPEDPATCGGTVIDGSNISCTPYQTSQIGNRTMRWLKTVLEKQTTQQPGKPQSEMDVGPSGSLAKPFFAYIGPHAPHYPATPAPWYETRFPDVTIPITPNYNISSPEKTQHIRQNPPLTSAAKCWEDQHFRDRWRTLLSVDELVGDVVAALAAADVLDNTYIFYSSDHGYKQGQWRVGTSKEHPYDTDIRVPLLARGPGIQAGSTYNYPSGNVDLTPTLLTLAAGAAYVPEFMDGKSLTAFLTPNLEADAAAKVAGWRKAFLNEYMSVGTYYNDHSNCWGNDKQCPGPVVIEGPDYTIFTNLTEEEAAAASVSAGTEHAPPGGKCIESNVTGGGNCWFVDSTLSNNWRQLRVVGGEDGLDFNYIEYDPKWQFEQSSMQYYELYNVSADKYQMYNIYEQQTQERKAELHKQLEQYFKCGSPQVGAIGKEMKMPAGKSNCP